MGGGGGSGRPRRNRRIREIVGSFSTALSALPEKRREESVQGRNAG